MFRKEKEKIIIKLHSSLLSAHRNRKREQLLSFIWHIRLLKHLQRSISFHSSSSNDVGRLGVNDSTRKLITQQQVVNCQAKSEDLMLNNKIQLHSPPPPPKLTDRRMLGECWGNVGGKNYTFKFSIL